MTRLSIKNDITPVRDDEFNWGGKTIHKMKVDEIGEALKSSAGALRKYIAKENPQFAQHKYEPYRQFLDPKPRRLAGICFYLLDALVAHRALKPKNKKIVQEVTEYLSGLEIALNGSLNFWALERARNATSKN